MAKKKKQKKVEKDFYTTFELIQQRWFPISSTVTLSKLIEQGKIHAVDISTGKHKRYRIAKKSAIDFIEKFSNRRGKIK